MWYVIIETCDFMQYFLQVKKWHFLWLIACDKFAKNAWKSRNAKIIAHAYYKLTDHVHFTPMYCKQNDGKKTIVQA